MDFFSGPEGIVHSHRHDVFDGRESFWPSARSLVLLSVFCGASPNLLAPFYGCCPSASRARIT